MWPQKPIIPHAATAKIKQFAPGKYKEIVATLSAMAKTATENGKPLPDDWWNKKLSLPPECLQTIEEAKLGHKTTCLVQDNVGKYQLAGYAKGEEYSIDELNKKALAEIAEAQKDVDRYLRQKSDGIGFRAVPFH